MVMAEVLTSVANRRTIVPAVVGHRLKPVGTGEGAALDPAEELIRAVAIP